MEQDTFGDVYLTNSYGRKNVEVIERHEARDGPLFLYASFNAGHDPLQALDTDFDECDAQVSADEEYKRELHGEDSVKLCLVRPRAPSCPRGRSTKMSGATYPILSRSSTSSLCYSM